MKKITFVLLALVNSCLAQTKYSSTSEEFNNFHYLISTAERMYKNDSSLQAYAKFDDAIQNYKGTVNPTHYFDFAMVALKIREEFKALDYFEKAITKGFVVDSNMMKFISFQNQNTKKEFYTNYPKWKEAHNANINSEWEVNLYQSTVDNKKYQSAVYTGATEFCVKCLANKACNKKAPEFLSKWKLVKEKQKADSVAVSQLLVDIKKHNTFPNLNVLDKEACATARTILLNYDADKTNSRLDDLLFKALNNADISPAFYATVIDRRNVMNGLLPEFYEPVTGYEKTIQAVMPVANAKRKTIGLHPIILQSKVKTAATPVKAAKGAKALEKSASPITDKNIYNY